MGMQMTISCGDFPPNDWPVAGSRATGDVLRGNRLWRFILAWDGTSDAKTLVITPLQIDEHTDIPPFREARIEPALHGLWSLIKLAQENLSGDRTPEQYQKEALAEARRLLECAGGKVTEDIVRRVYDAARWSGIDRTLCLLKAKCLLMDHPDIGKEEAFFKAWRQLVPAHPNQAEFAALADLMGREGGGDVRRFVLLAHHKQAPEWFKEWTRGYRNTRKCNVQEAERYVVKRVCLMLHVPSDGGAHHVYPLESIIEVPQDADDRAALKANDIPVADEVQMPATPTTTNRPDTATAKEWANLLGCSPDRINDAHTRYTDKASTVRELCDCGKRRGTKAFLYRRDDIHAWAQNIGLRPKPQMNT